MGQPAIALIRTFASAPIGDSVEGMLRDAFPEHALDVFDVTRLIQAHPLAAGLNLFAVARHYGPDLLRGTKRPRSAFLATPYLFRQVRGWLRARLAARDYHFTFQLQSLFDASTDRAPHFVYTDHSHLANLEYPDFDPRRLYAAAWIALERSIYQRATRVFTRSSNIARSLSEQYAIAPEKVHCVYAGSNARLPDAAPDPARYAGKRVLFVGLDWERKGGPTLLDAFRQVLAVHPDAHLTIVGAAPAVSLPNITVVGPVPVGEVHRYYESASLFCLPTTLEPFGVVFVEAMAHGLPLVATRVGAVPDFVIEGYNGALVPPGDAGGLAEALIRLLGDADRCRGYGENSRELVRERYNWSGVGRAIRSHIEAALEPGHTGHHVP